MAIWISLNIDSRRSLNSRDSFPRRKFKNRAPTSCSPDPILSTSTIGFELHVKTAEEIDLECAIFATSEAPWPWPWIRSRSNGWAYRVEVYQHTKFDRNRKKTLWTYVRTYGRTHLISSPKNWAPTSCRPGFILSPPTISFALHAKTAEDIDLE